MWWDDVVECSRCGRRIKYAFAAHTGRSGPNGPEEVHLCGWCNRLYSKEIAKGWDEMLEFLRDMPKPRRTRTNKSLPAPPELFSS